MDTLTPFERFVEPARRKPALWRLFLGIVLFLVIYGLVTAILTVLVIYLVDGADVSHLVTEQAMSDPWSLLWLLSTFLGMLIAPLVVVRVLHGRRGATLIGRGAVVLRDFSITTGALLAIGLPITGFWVLFGEVEPNLPPMRWLSFLPLVLIAIAVQTLSEEVLFRGYVMQQLAARFRSPLIWMVVPSVIFGALHFNASMPLADALGVVAIITVFGFVAADLTVRTGSLGAAWGFHFANNFIALTLVSVDGTLTGLSLFKTTIAAQDGLPASMYIGDLVLILGGWWLMRRLLQR